MPATLAHILPPGVAIGEWRDGDPEPAAHPAELASLGVAADVRRLHFARGRACARWALQQLGVDPTPILRGPARQPIWPAGVIGSITHCHGYAAAVVARPDAVRALGIDAELRRPLDPGVRKLVVTPAESARLDPRDPQPWDLVLFSAKESVFKAWHPIADVWLGFDEADVTVDPANATFTATLATTAVARGGGKVRQLLGRFAITDTHVFTIATVPLIR